MAASPKVPGNRLTFRSWGGSAKLTEGFFRYKKRQIHRYVSPFRLPTTLAFAAVLFPFGVEGQTIFDWPIRAAPQPEAVLTGAGAVFWNPGSLVSEVGTSQEIWVVHVDGPDATGVRGVATAGVIDLPLGLRGGVGYWHLGIQDIPRTTTSPHHEPGEINIAEDVAILALARNLAGRSGVGGALRLSEGGRWRRRQESGGGGDRYPPPFDPSPFSPLRALHPGVGWGVGDTWWGRAGPSQPGLLPNPDPARIWDSRPRRSSGSSTTGSRSEDPGWTNSTLEWASPTSKPGAVGPPSGCSGQTWGGTPFPSSGSRWRTGSELSISFRWQSGSPGGPEQNDIRRSTCLV